MLTMPETMKALQGAYRLARFDKGGLAHFENTSQGAMRSFYAAALVAPFYVLFVASRRADGDMGVDPWRAAIIEGIAYVIAWVAFPLVMAWLARIIDRERRYLLFVSAYNWCQVPQYALHLGVALALAAGMMGEEAAAFFGVITFLYVLAYTWFVVRGALDISGVVAAGIVGVDFLVGMMIKLSVVARLHA